MLFNKDMHGSRELYELSGTFQASTDFHGIESEIDTATAEVAAIVGDEIIAAADKAYNAPIPSKQQAALSLAVRKPIAYLAIALHARLNGLSHGETGRKLKVDDNEKIPFEWMIDRDDREMRERYYRAIDALIRFLEGSGETAWKAAAAKQRTANCIVKGLADLEDVYPIEHSYYTFYKLVPILLEVQNGRLCQVLGTETVAALIAGGTQVAGVRALAIRFLVLQAMVQAVQRWSVDVFPLAVARRFAPSYQGNKENRAATMEEIDWYLSKLSLQAKSAELELRDAAAGNPWKDASLLPENRLDKKYFTV